jgi:hypothetical protein
MAFVCVGSGNEMKCKRGVVLSGVLFPDCFKIHHLVQSVERYSLTNVMSQ